ncbi:uncharacterized protein G2W53_033014 [Senna tora]|uniref:Uncharacterized protein n=1 Tax=Senna tora TaxID=362788 RepID=A0A834SYH7_9FABA|nr:uncharacterized protein G2W53_033014 [Senna tora]
MQTWSNGISRMLGSQRGGSLDSKGEQVKALEYSSCDFSHLTACEIQWEGHCNDGAHVSFLKLMCQRATSRRLI